MAAIDSAREVLAALRAAEDELNRLIAGQGDAEIAVIRDKVTEQVKKLAALRQKHDERSRGLAALATEVAEREAAITRVAEQLDRDPPIFTEGQKTELLGLLGRR